MQVTVEYTAQIKRAAGLASETLDMADGATLSQLITQLAAGRDEALQRMLVTGDGVPQPTLLVFVRDEQRRLDDATPLADGDVVTFLSPISGG
jgi:molybdopterin converting factor small subunit